MTNEPSTPGDSPGLAQSWIAQLRKITEDLAGVTGLGRPDSPSLGPSLLGLPLPGSLSAAQLGAISSATAAQRSSIAALQAQLSAFDDQLAVLERILGPLTDWSEKWAELERRATNTRGRPETDS